MLIKSNIKNSLLLLFVLFLSFEAYSAPSKKEIQKLNNSIIFDLLVNYELTGRNGNLSAIIDFMPNMENVNYRSLVLKTNIGDQNQTCSFEFNDNRTISNLKYEVNGKTYRFEFNYEANRLVNIHIGGKPKLLFTYTKKGQILTVTRDNGGQEAEYTFEYLEGENKANIKLAVIQNGNRKESRSQRSYLTWNAKHKIESYCFDVFCSKNLSYSPQGDLLSFNFAAVNDDNSKAVWEYSALDDKLNWTERKFQNYLFTRTIEY